MKIVDARGKVCPQPVILTKTEVDAGELKITVIVDNDTSKTNVIKFGTKQGFQCNDEIKEDGIYVTLTKDVDSIEKNDDGEANKELLINNLKMKKESKGYVIGKNTLGSGSEKLGALLMKSFIFTISETKPYPSFMIFLNGGVKLTTQGSESIEDLMKLEKAGVKIVSCGTCLDFFEIKGKLLVGEVSNMYDIVETINNSDNTIMI